MKKIILLSLLFFFTASLYASKLTEFFHKMDAQQKAREQREWQEDMDFGSLAFHLERRYRNDKNQICREYSFLSKKNRYREGSYTVCDLN